MLKRLRRHFPRLVSNKKLKKMASMHAEAVSMHAALATRVSALEAQLKLAEDHQTRAFWHALDQIYDTVLQDRTLSCIICGHSAERSDFAIRLSRCIFGGGKLERYECPNCECIFGSQKFLDLGEDLLDLEYRLLYSRYREGDTTANEVRTFRSLDPQEGSAYVNWGSGAWNRTVADMRSEGWNLWGYEPSAPREAPFVARTKAQLPAGIAGLMSNNVIEHFLDPVAQFREFHDLLSPGGRMAHSTPCFEYRYEFSRFHTVFLLGKSPEILAERTGFKVIERVRDGEYLNYVFEKCGGEPSRSATQREVQGSFAS
jgi:hypothetical protein